MYKKKLNLIIVHQLIKFNLFQVLKKLNEQFKKMRLIKLKNNICLKKYYLLNNAKVHKTKKIIKFLEIIKMNIIYYAFYHS